MTSDKTKQLDINLTIIEMMMVKEAKKVLQDTILKEMDEMLTKVAVEAVKGFAEVQLSKDAEQAGLVTSNNYNVHFIQKVVNTVMKDSPVVAVYKDKK